MGGDNVKVAVRVRPFNGREKDRKAKNCIRMEANMTMISNPDTGAEKKFTFDYSYDSYVPRDHPDYASQTTVWNDIGKGVLENAYEGYNCSLFAYGQTGAGKSYSMMGYGEDVGIIPIACEEIFKRVDSNEDTSLTYKVEASMLEIYMEKVKDLFNPRAEKPLKVRDHPKKGPYVEGLVRHPVESFKEINKLMEAGTRARTVASTNMNATSSRAHTIFQIVLTQTKVDKARGKATDKVAIINLIDLAGSERQSGTGATGDRLKEGCAINQSLSALGNVISKLAEKSGLSGKKAKKILVPYRDSVLTLLLKTSLGGNAKTIMIAAVSPADINYDETISTLRYADRAKQIKNKAIVNEDPNEKLIKGLKEEIEELRRRLEAGGGGGPSTPGAALSAPSEDVDAIVQEERKKLREQLEKERQEEMKRFQEQLAANEALLKEQEKSWEDKVREAAEREAELAALGVINTGASKEEVAEKAGTVPHISNLNDDPAMCGALVYFLDKETTRIGRKDADVPQDIMMSGLAILKEHALIVYKEEIGKVTLLPMDGAKVFVNGIPINVGTECHHGSRIILGNNHVFQLIHPKSLEHLKQKREVGECPEWVGDPENNTVDWQFAVNEMNKAQMEAIKREEEALRKRAEEEAAAMRDQIAALEASIQKEREEHEDEFKKKEREFMHMEVKLEAAIEARQSEVGADKSDATTIKLMKELEAARHHYESEKNSMETAARELEERLKTQKEESERLARAKEKRMRERAELDSAVMHALPLITEVNTMSEEMSKGQKFGLRLMADQTRAKQAVREEDEENFDALVGTQLWVRVSWIDGSRPHCMWHIDKFHNRLFLMREMYQAYVEGERDLAYLTHPEGAGYTAETDPFLDPPGEILIGTASVFLESLAYLLDVNESTPIIDYKGKEEGELTVRIFPHTTENPEESKAEGKPTVTVEDLLAGEKSITSMLGRKMYFTVCVDQARGLPSRLSTDVFATYRWFGMKDPTSVPPCPYKTINPALGGKETFKVIITEEFIEFITKDAIDFEVYGSIDRDAQDAFWAAAAAASAATRPPDDGLFDGDDAASDGADGGGGGEGAGEEKGEDDPRALPDIDEDEKTEIDEWPGAGGSLATKDQRTEIEEMRNQMEELNKAMQAERDARKHAEQQKEIMDSQVDEKLSKLESERKAVADEHARRQAEMDRIVAEKEALAAEQAKKLEEMELKLKSKSCILV